MKTRAILIAGCLAAAAQAWAGADAELAALIPQLAATDVESRQTPKMVLQAAAACVARPGAEPERAALAAALAAKAQDATVPQPARVWIVRQLELIGGAESVPALAKTLSDSDAELRECARRALELNPAPAASEALRAALDKGGPAAWRIGLLDALGRRGDAASLKLMTAALRDPETAAVAADAIARLGDAPALAALVAADDGKNLTMAQAVVAAAVRIRAADPKASLAALERIAAAGHPAAARGAALFELAAAEPASAAKRIPAALQDSDREVRWAAVAAARAAKDPALGAALAAQLPQLPVETRATVVGLLDASQGAAVVAAAGDADENVRLAAVGTLGQIGGGAAVPALLKCAASDSRDEKAAAEMALTRVCGQDVAAALARGAAAGEAKGRAAAMAAMAVRGQAGAVPVLLQAAADADATVNRAAFSALRTLATESDLDALAKLILAVPGNDSMLAFKAVALRAADKASVSKKLLASMPAADAKAKGILLDALSATGGAEALAAAVDGLAAKDNALREGAVRALGNWGDWAAAAPLLKVAADAAATDKQRILALQGVGRLAQTCAAAPAAARAEAALAAMQLAKRDEDKQQLLAALGAAPDPRSVPVVKAMLAEPKFKAAAAAAAVALAEGLIATDKVAAKALAKAAKDTKLPKELDGRAGAVLRVK